jgi:hypothetical protein
MANDRVADDQVDFGGAQRLDAASRVDFIIFDAWLSAGQHFTTSWTFGGEPAGSMNVRTEPGAVVLVCQTRSWHAAEWKPITQRVPITWTGCHFGGRRPWFICSVCSDGQYCGRRVAILYGAGTYFACRHCYGLAYETQQQSARWRGFATAQKIRMRLDGSVDLLEPFPEKPRRMHRRTYERLHHAYEIAKRRCFRGIMGRGCCI